MKNSNLLALLLVAASLHALPAHSADAVAPSDPAAFAGKLVSNQKLTTRAGTQVTGPAGWTVRRKDAVLIFDAPENDSHLALADVQALTVEGALKSAWAQYRPEERHALRVILPRAPRDGWDESHFADYDVSPNERLAIAAVAMRHGDAWSVVIIDATEQLY